MMNKRTFYQILLISCLTAFSNLALAQCCAGGTGCSIAGSAATGVLQPHQIEISSSFQFNTTDKFYKKDKVASDFTRTFDSYSSAYQYLKVGYGVTKNFTFSVEGGYYFDKKEIGLNGDPTTTYKSSGFGDLILFPRYDILNQTRGNHHHEITLGLGYKIPLGSYKDSTGNIEPFSGATYYVTNPTAVQLSSGAQDLIFYTFLSRGYNRQKFNISASAYYIRKSYNNNGEKLGDYTSVALFATKTLFKQLGVTLQARYEQVQPMKIKEDVLLFGRPSNYNPEATGYKAISITPQVSYTLDRFSFFASSDFPVYQYLNTSDYYTQVGLQNQITIGIAYRFYAKKQLSITEIGVSN